MHRRPLEISESALRNHDRGGQQSSIESLSNGTFPFEHRQGGIRGRPLDDAPDFRDSAIVRTLDEV